MSALLIYDSNKLTGSIPANQHRSDPVSYTHLGIYIGYKYYETRYEDTVLNQGNATTTEGSSTGKAWNYVDEVTYPFGYGLSYTTFTQELESVDVISGEKGLAKVKVTNTGDVAGKDVVQLYVQTPYIEGGLEKASIQLLDFGKTEVLLSLIHI